MKKFEYKYLQVPKQGLFGSNVDLEKLIEQLNVLGEKGWEAVASFEENQMQSGDKYTTIIVKREIQ
jgi:hypothetical protein